MSKLKYILCIISSFLFLSCSSKQENIFENVFNKEEMEIINKIIDSYDAFVLSHVDKNTPINRAYTEFLDKTTIEAERSGNLGLLVPSRKNILSLFEGMNKNILKNLFYFQDSVSVYDWNTKEHLRLYAPYSFDISSDSKYYHFLEKVSIRNEFLKEYYMNAVSSGDFNNPSNLAAMLVLYDNLDFERKDERIVFIMHFITINEDLYEKINQLYKETNHRFTIHMNDKSRQSYEEYFFK